jgi:hypothetical protein
MRDCEEDYVVVVRLFAISTELGRRNKKSVP